MRRLCCTAQFVAALALAGCGTVEVFGQYDLKEGPTVADAPWPRLVDTPVTPEKGTYTAAVPDPKSGEARRTELSDAAADAAARAAALSGPVISDDDKATIKRRSKRKR